MEFERQANNAADGITTRGEQVRSGRQRQRARRKGFECACI
jgi:hypothetical protein